MARQLYPVTMRCTIFIDMIAPKGPRAMHKLARFFSKDHRNTHGYWAEYLFDLQTCNRPVLCSCHRAPVAHLVVRRAVTREIVSSRLRPDQHSGSLNNRREKCCLCNFICKWLNFLVFSDKDDKPEVPSHNFLNVDNSVGR